jgi:hypothetical protein
MSATASTHALDGAQPLETQVHKLHAAFALLCSVLALVALAGALRWPMVHDAPIMNYVGWRIAQGDVPYAALFDMNLPATYAFHALLALAPGSWDLRTALAHVALVIACAALCAIWTTRISGRALAGVVAGGLCVLLCLSLGPYHALQRDLLLALPALAALLLASASDAPSLRRFLLVGALFGCASAIKPQALLLLGGYGLAALLHDATRRSLRARLPSAVLALVAGLALAWAPLLLWIAWRGGLTELFATVLPLSGTAYVRISHALITGSEAGTLRSFVAPELASFGADRVLRWIVVAAAAYDVLFDRRCVQRLTAELAAVAGVAMYLLQLKGWPYHLYPSLVLLGVPISLVLSERARPASVDRARFALHALIVCAATVVGLRAVQTSLRGALPEEKATRTAHLVRELAPRVRDGASLQIFDTAEGGADVLLRLGLRLPTSMLYDFPLFLAQLGPELDLEPVRRVRARFLAELYASRPDYLLVFAPGWPRGGLERIGWIPELETWIETTYCSVALREDYGLLARRDRQECASSAYEPQLQR